VCVRYLCHFTGNDHAKLNSLRLEGDLAIFKKNVSSGNNFTALLCSANNNKTLSYRRETVLQGALSGPHHCNKTKIKVK